MKRTTLIGFSVLFMTGCAFQPVKVHAETTYLLTGPSLNPAQIQHYRGKQNLLLSEISAPRWLSTNQMAYQLSNSQLNYFAQNEWAAPPAQMLEPIVVHALSHAGIYRAVVQAPFGGNVNQRLDIQLLQMQQDFTQNPSVYHFTLQAELINEISGNIIGTRYFNYVIPTTANNPQSGVDAANKAIEEWIPQLIDFCRKSPANT